MMARGVRSCDDQHRPHHVAGCGAGRSAPDGRRSPWRPERIRAPPTIVAPRTTGHIAPIRQPDRPGSAPRSPPVRAGAGGEPRPPPKIHTRSRIDGHDTAHRRSASTSGRPSPPSMPPEGPARSHTMAKITRGEAHEERDPPPPPRLPPRALEGSSTGCPRPLVVGAQKKGVPGKGRSGPRRGAAVHQVQLPGSKDRRVR